MENTLREYNNIKPKVWEFIEGFRGNKKFGKTEAAAYISMLSEIHHVETGANIAEGLKYALNMAYEKLSGGLGELKTNYEKTYNNWLELDRRKIDLKRFVPFENQVKPKTYRPAEPVYSISLFTGAYGLDLGFEQAGFEVTLGLDISSASYENFHANRPGKPFITEDINKISIQDILKEAGLKPGEVDVLTGGPPCQPFSTAGKRLALNDPRASALMRYIDAINEMKPKVFVMEEVPGLLSARIKHVPLKERGKRPLTPEEKPGSVWRVVLEELRKTGYIIKWKKLNAADYGTPQIRERIIVIGVRPDIARKKRITEATPLHPTPTHTGYARRPKQQKATKSKEKPLDEWVSPTKLRPWVTLAEAIADIKTHDGMASLGPKYTKYVKYVPPGGNWRQIPDELKPAAMNGSLYSGGGRTSTYRRLSWYYPSPTLLTSPTMKATMRIHPLEDRPLSVREYLRIQGFPDDWKVVLPISHAYRHFGEAVPVPLARAVALKVRRDILGVPDA